MNQLDTLSQLPAHQIMQHKTASFREKSAALGAEDAGNDIPDEITLSDGAVVFPKKEVRISPEYELRYIKTKTHLLVGGLSHDSDVESPSTSMGGEGRVLMRGRRGQRSDDSEINAALGLDGYGEKDLRNEIVSEILANQAIASIKSNKSLMTTLSNLIRHQRINGLKGKGGGHSRVFDCIRMAVHQEGWEFARDYIAEYFLGARIWLDLDEAWQEKLEPLIDCFLESKAEAAWEKAMEEGKIGNRLAVMLDVYEHSGIALSISGEGMQCRWDTSRGGAVWIPDACAEENIRSNTPPSLSGSDAKEQLQALRAEAKKYARTCLATYNAWLNGETYLFSTTTINLVTGEIDEGDTCYGIYGTTDAVAELEAAMLSTLSELVATRH